IGDLEYMIKGGATSFHGSVELWKNPFALSSELKKIELDALRSGWDFILDIDCDEGFEYARVTAILLVSALETFGINNISAKFSGSRGIHVAVSHKAFPEKIDGKNISNMYPELPRNIVGFLRAFIRKKLTERFMEIDRSSERLMKDEGTDELDPYNIVDVEENWGVRHLFRLPYSFNEKTWLVSRPLRKEDISDFKFEDARPENVKGDIGFLESWEENEAATLVLETMDWAESQEELEKKMKKDHPNKYEGRTFEGPLKKIDEKYFPPCIQKILEGLEDGRKRAIFVLINFLMTCGWPLKEIEGLLLEWNKRNADPIKTVYITTQLNYAAQKEKAILPANCENKGYYKDMKVCVPDGFCQKIQNPATYAIKKSSVFEKGKKKQPKTQKKSKSNAEESQKI
ncbi:MAG: DNA primase small subunit domain-containing protein, partial [archaeon]|nr:DNA primase small subunit domain-containing protein [archaeon]